MYSLGQLLEGLRRPRRAALEINRLFAEAVLLRLRPKTGFFERDWDNLIVLDACRYDAMREVGFAPDQLEWRWADGTNSSEFVEYSVRNGPLDDVVWVTANPWVSRFHDSIFEVVELWDTGWDDDRQTVPPDIVTAEARAAERRFPNKRIVAHYMQPHYPFIGDAGVDLPDYATFTGGGRIKSEKEAPTIWDHLRSGTVGRDQVWTAYLSNLELVLPQAESLAESLAGKSVITSDHGNAFGSRTIPIPYRLYGHPRGLRHAPLAKVPWIEFESDRRKDVETGEIRSEAGSSELIEDRLEHLGYRT